MTRKITPGFAIAMLVCIGLVALPVILEGRRSGEPTPAGLVSRAAHEFETGTKQAFREVADWLDDGNFSQAECEAELRAKLRAVIEHATGPLMRDGLDRSIVRDADGTEQWSRERMVEVLRELGE